MLRAAAAAQHRLPAGTSCPPSVRSFVRPSGKVSRCVICIGGRFLCRRRGEFGNSDVYQFRLSGPKRGGKRKVGCQNSRVPSRFSLSGHVSDFATPPCVSLVSRSRLLPLRAATCIHFMISSRRSRLLPLRAATCIHFMISSRIATSFAYFDRSALSPKREFRK